VGILLHVPDAFAGTSVLDDRLQQTAADRAVRREPERRRRTGVAVFRARLPPDARGLVLIMSDIGRGGMNDAVITIEEARGKLADALAPAPAPDASPAP